MHLPRRLLAVAAATSAVAAFGVLGPSQAALAATSPQETSTSSVAGAFYPLDVQRLLGATNGAAVALTPRRATTVMVQGRDGLPSSGISAAVVNVVVTAGPKDADVSLSSVDAQPGTGVQTFRVKARTTRALLLTVPLATSGAFAMTSSGPATALADLEGFYAADDTVVASVGLSGGYQPVDPQRLYDSRETASPLAASDRRLLAVDLGTATPNVTALLLRVTTGAAKTAGSLTVEPSSSAEPWPSVTYPAGSSGTNLAVVPAELGSDGRLDVAVENNGTAATDVSVDLVGFYDDGQLGPNLRFRPLDPAIAGAGASGAPTASVDPKGTVSLQPGQDVVGESTFGLVGLLTVAPRAGGAAADLALTTADQAATGASADAAATVATTSDAATTPVQVEVSADGSLVLSSTSGAAHVDLDVVGTLESSPPVAPGAPRSWVAPVSSWEISAVVR